MMQSITLSNTKRVPLKSYKPNDDENVAESLPRNHNISLRQTNSNDENL